MAQGQRCVACRALVPAAAEYCPACGRSVLPDEDAARIDFDVSSTNPHEQTIGDAVLRVGARERTRTQLFAIGGVLVVLLVIAVLVGRGRSKPVASPRTTLAPTTTATDVSSTTVASPTSLAPVTTAPSDATTTSTTISPVVPLANVPTTVVAMTLDGALLRIDLVSGVVTAGPRVPTVDQPARVVVVNGGVFVGTNGGRLFFIASDASVTRWGVGGGWESPVGSPDGTGVVVYQASNLPYTAGYARPGDLTYPEINIPTGSVVGLVDGGVVIDTNRLGVYRIDLQTGAASRLLAGAFLAALHNEVAGLVCDASLHCEMQVVVNGRVKFHWPLPTGMSIDQFSGAAFSPDGKRLAYTGIVARQTLIGIVDLASGRATTASAFDADSPSLAWMPSGQGVMWTAGGDLNYWSGSADEPPVGLALNNQAHISIAAFALTS